MEKYGDVKSAKKFYLKGCKIANDLLYGQIACNTYARLEYDLKDGSGFYLRLLFGEKNNNFYKKSASFWSDVCDKYGKHGDGDAIKNIEWRGCYELSSLMKKLNINQISTLIGKKAVSILISKMSSQTPCEEYDMKSYAARGGDATLRCYRKGYLEEARGNVVKARKIYSKLCGNGYLDGCGSVGSLEERAGNIVKARKIFSELCSGGLWSYCNSWAKLEKKQGNMAKSRDVYAKTCSKLGGKNLVKSSIDPMVKSTACMMKDEIFSKIKKKRCWLYTRFYAKTMITAGVKNLKML